MLTASELQVLSAMEGEEYRQWEQGFASPFWQKINDMANQRSAEALYRAAGAGSWDENRINAGQRQVWDFLANLEAQVELEFSSKCAERLVDTDEESDDDYT